jgi:hypothetical protein
MVDNSVGRVLEGILKAELILIDAIGFSPMGGLSERVQPGFAPICHPRTSLAVARVSGLRGR